MKLVYDGEIVAAKLFYSYAHADEDLRKALETHLSSMQRLGLIEAWHDRRIVAGQRWSDEIDEHLRQADIILLLISSDFLASNYCYDVEMAIALERHGRGDAVVIPVILRPVDWSGTPFAHLQALPRDARPVTTWANRDEALANIAAGIRAALKQPLQPPVWDPPQDRALDAAMPSRVTVGQPCELLMLVRQTQSEGLRAVIAVETDDELNPEDVKSKAFQVDFPLDGTGRPCPALLEVRVESPGFEPPAQKKQISVPVSGDSQICRFLLTPRQAGNLAVLIEVLQTDIQQTSRRLRTQAHAALAQPAVTYNLTSMPLLTISSSSTLAFAMRRPAAAEAAAAGPQFVPRVPPAAAAPPVQTSPPNEPGEFTRMFKTPAPPAPSPIDRAIPPPLAMPAPPAPASPKPRANRAAVARAAAVVLCIFGSVALFTTYDNRSGSSSQSSPTPSPQASERPRVTTRTEAPIVASRPRPLPQAQTASPPPAARPTQQALWSGIIEADGMVDINVPAEGWKIRPVPQDATVTVQKLSDTRVRLRNTTQAAVQVRVVRD